MGRLVVVGLVLLVACGDDSASPDTGVVPVDGAVDGPMVETDGGPAPTLESRVPEDSAGNVWVFAPIEARYSGPLDPASVTEETVQLSAGGTDVPRTVSLSDDGQTILVSVTTPPQMPATLEVAIAGVRGVGTPPVAEERWSFDLPVWQQPGAGALNATLGGSEPALAVGDGLYVAWVDTSLEPDAVRLAEFDGSDWNSLGSPLNVGASVDVRHPSLVIDDAGQPVVGWVEGRSGSVYAARWEGDAFAALDDGGLPTGEDVVLLADSGTLRAVVLSSGAIAQGRLEADAWVFDGPGFNSVGDIVRIDAALDRSDIVVAYLTRNGVDGDAGGIRWSASTSQWVDLGMLDRISANLTKSARIALGSDGAPLLSWVENDGTSDTLFTARYNTAASQWESVGGALDLELDQHVATPALAASADQPVVAWSEGDSPTSPSSLLVAQRMGPRWRFLGGPVNDSDSDHTDLADIALDDQGQPVVVFRAFQAGDPSTAEILVKRYNGSPEPPRGLTDLGSITGCDIPDDGAAFPRTLTATGCYANVGRQQLLPGFVPYTINSKLWSDGALKRRYIGLPDGATMGFMPVGAMRMPVGTVLIKEFLLEATPGDRSTVFPVETRIFVKRCQEGDCVTPWQGYSYQWNDTATDADLLDNTGLAMEIDWPLADGSMQTHIYPGRNQCVECHNAESGRVLGIQAIQLDLSYRFGDVVDHQLLAMEAAGLFGSGATLDLAAIRPLPQPHDISQGVGQRTRAYFHSNCAHCHRPAGVRPMPDFRFEAPLTGNICNFLVPGDPDMSPIFVKDRTRPPDSPLPFAGTGMPPLATNIPDRRQLPSTQAWISTLTGCP